MKEHKDRVQMKILSPKELTEMDFGKEPPPMLHKPRDPYDAISSQDAVPAAPYGCINYKSSDMCMSLVCVCGYNGHIDAEFFHYYECRQCHRKYALGTIVKLIPLTQEQATILEADGSIFKEDTDICWDDELAQLRLRDE